MCSKGRQCFYITHHFFSLCLSACVEEACIEARLEAHTNHLQFSDGRKPDLAAIRTCVPMFIYLRAHLLESTSRRNEFPRHTRNPQDATVSCWFPSNFPTQKKRHPNMFEHFRETVCLNGHEALPFSPRAAIAEFTHTFFSRGNQLTVMSVGFLPLASGFALLHDRICRCATYAFAEFT